MKYQTIPLDFHPRFRRGSFRCKCSSADDSHKCFEISDTIILLPVFQHLFEHFDLRMLLEEIMEYIEETAMPVDYVLNRLQSELKKAQRIHSLNKETLLQETRPQMRSIVLEQQVDVEERIELLQHRIVLHESNSEAIDYPDEKEIVEYLSRIHLNWASLPKETLLQMLRIMCSHIQIKADGYQGFFVRLIWAYDDSFEETLWIERALRFRPNHVWADAELDFIEANSHLSNRELVKLFPDLTIETIRSAPNKIRGVLLGKARGKVYEQWTEEEDDYLRKYAEDKITYTQIRKNVLPYRSLRSVNIRLRDLGLQPMNYKLIYWYLMPEDTQKLAGCTGCAFGGHTSAC